MTRACHLPVRFALYTSTHDETGHRERRRLRATVARLDARARGRLHVGLAGLVGLAIAALCLWAFLAIAEDVPENGRMVHLDVAITAWLQDHGTEGGEAIFSALSLLGSQVLTAVVVLVAVVFAARREWRRLAVLAITCGGGALLNTGLKLLFQRHRPAFAAEFNLKTWGFPSGHAMNSLICYGLFAHWIVARYPRARVAVLIATALLVGAIGYSRIYLGVHYLSDVAAGYSAGLMWLIACIAMERLIASRRHEPVT